jgi:hypothetical protein
VDGIGGYRMRLIVQSHCLMSVTKTARRGTQMRLPQMVSNNWVWSKIREQRPVGTSTCSTKLVNKSVFRTVLSKVNKVFRVSSACLLIGSDHGSNETRLDARHQKCFCISYQRPVIFKSMFQQPLSILARVSWLRGFTRLARPTW